MQSSGESIKLLKKLYGRAAKLQTPKIKVCLLTFQPVPVQVYIFGFGQCWVFVEEVGHKGQVEFGAPADDISRGDKLSAAEPLGLLQHGLGPLQVVSLLNNTQGRSLGSDTHAAHPVPRGGPGP